MIRDQLLQSENKFYGGGFIVVFRLKKDGDCFFGYHDDKEAYLKEIGRMIDSEKDIVAIYRNVRAGAVGVVHKAVNGVKKSKQINLDGLLD